MRIQDLHDLPKFRDGLSYLYLERGRIEQAQKAVEFFSKDGRVMIPAAALALLMLGPGTAITHEAIKTLAANGVVIVWVGEEGAGRGARAVAPKGSVAAAQTPYRPDSCAQTRAVGRLGVAPVAGGWGDAAEPPSSAYQPCGHTMRPASESV